MIWGAMGHCYLMMDDLQKAYTAYQQALYHLPNPNEPKLWYGIGILYDRYGSLDHAEEAFSSVVRMDPSYEKVNEIYFRLGIIYKQQGQYEASLECFRYILNNPPPPLTEMDIHFQIGLVFEQQGEFNRAKDVYERVLAETPNHAKVLQQLGWLFLQPATGYVDHVQAVKLLSQSLGSDPNDPQSWYLLGRAYVSAEEYNDAYEAYKQGLYRDSKNAILWCSIGILYYQIDQFRDALGAYSRSIRINPYIPEVWLNLGILYESSNNQVDDAIDAYKRAIELDPENEIVNQRLHMLEKAKKNDELLPPPPPPQDVHPSAYATATLPADNATAESAREDEIRGGSWSYEPEEYAKNDPRETTIEGTYAYNRQQPYTDSRDTGRGNAASYNRYEDSRYSMYPTPRYASKQMPDRDRRYESERGYARTPNADPRAEHNGQLHRAEDYWRGPDPYARNRPQRSFSASVRSTDGDREPLRPTEMRSNPYHRDEPAKEPIFRPYSSSRDIDENYDDSAASSLMGLAGAAASMVEAEERNKEARANARASESANAALDAVEPARAQAQPGANSGKHTLDNVEESSSKRPRSEPSDRSPERNVVGGTIDAAQNGSDARGVPRASS